MITFGEWTPDNPDLNNAGSTVAKNVYPRTEGSYGSWPSLGSVTDALGARCQGAVAARHSDGTVTTFAGTASKLYSLTGTAWADESGATYSTGGEEAWSFAQYGSRVLATNYADPIQSFTLGSSPTFSDLSADAPKARRIAAIKDFVMVGNTYDAGDGEKPNRVWWCAQDNPASWPTPRTAAAATAQSDYQDLPSGDWVQQITGAIGGADGAIFLEKAIYRVQYEGPPTIMGFYEVERARGTPAPHSVVNTGPLAFYLGEDGFYVFNGSSSQPIGAQKIDKTFFADLDQSAFHRIVGASDPINKLVVWIYPGSGNVNGTPNKAVIFNWAINRWSQAEFDSEWIFRDLSQGYTLDGLDALGYTLDTLPASLDSRIWTGGRFVLSAFDTSHMLSRFTGSPLAATLETGEIGAGRRMYVKGVRPYVDGGTVTVAIKHRDTPGGALTTSSANAVEASGAAAFRIACRYARAQVNIAAGGSWTHAQGIDVESKQEGKR